MISTALQVRCHEKRRGWRNSPMKRNLSVSSTVGLVLFLCMVMPARAQVQVSGEHTLNGQKLFEQRCTTCHGNANSAQRAPDRETLMKLTPEAVLAALTTGPMRSCRQREGGVRLHRGQEWFAGQRASGVLC
jgi:mono/diheme cytochrome c family protein